jgi:hypothetical protein
MMTGMLEVARGCIGGLLIVGGLACGESATPIDQAKPEPDASSEASTDASVDAASPGACVCEEGEPVASRQECTTFCLPAPRCGGSYHCDKLPYGAGVHFTLTGPGPWGQGEDASIEREYERSHLPNDSDGAICWMREVDGVSTYQLAVSYGFQDGWPFRSDLLDFQLHLENVSGPGEFTVPADDSADRYVSVAVGLAGGSEQIRAYTGEGSTCTVLLSDVLHGTFSCTGLRGHGITEAGTAELPASYGLEGSFFCRSVSYELAVGRF